MHKNRHVCNNFYKPRSTTIKKPLKTPNYTSLQKPKRPVIVDNSSQKQTQSIQNSQTTFETKRWQNR